MTRYAIYEDRHDCGGVTGYTDTGTGNDSLTNEAEPGLPPDITERFDELLSLNLLELYHYYENMYYCYYNLSGDETYARKEAWDKAVVMFIDRVRTGGDWDLKNGVIFPDKDQNGTRRYYLYRGEIYSGEDLGNIHFGYVGSFLFRRSILHLGAGLYQVYSGFSIDNWPTYFDDPRDFQMIDYGCDLFDKR